MKLWLKPALAGAALVAAATALVPVFAQDAGVPPPPPGADVAEHQAHLLARIGRRLNLDDPQKAKLQALADLLKSQRQAMLQSGTDPRKAVQALIAGNTFDRAGAQALVNDHVARMQANSPALIAAVGDFYDSLNATQQQQVREFVGRHHGPMWRHRPTGAASAVGE